MPWNTQYPLTNYTFCIFDSYQEVLAELEDSDEHINHLQDKTNLQDFSLLLNDKIKKYTSVDFTGTTVEQAIKKILAFYSDKEEEISHYRYFEGIVEWEQKSKNKITVAANYGS